MGCGGDRVKRRTIKRGKTKHGDTWELQAPAYGPVIWRVPDRLEDCVTPGMCAAWHIRQERNYLGIPDSSKRNSKVKLSSSPVDLPRQWAIKALTKRLKGKRYTMGRWAARAAEALWDGSRDGCPICHVEITRDNMSIDHIKPVSKNGKNSGKNFQLLCKRCNSRKGDR